jgi:serine/threonine-protein kinase
LGVVLYEMLTGVVPFEAEGALAMAMKHVTEEPIAPRERDPHVPEAMEALVMGLLGKDPEARCGSAFELAEDLRKARAELPPAYLAGAAERPEAPQEPASADRGVHPGEPASEPSRRKRPVAIGLVALAALMALVGAFGWDLTGAREGSKAVKAVGTVTTTDGTRDGGGPAAPVSSRDAQEGGSGNGVGQSMPSVELAGGAYVPASSSAPSSASASASASAPASASTSVSAPASASASPQAWASEPAASGPWASAPQAPEPSAATPSASASPAPGGGSSGSGGQDAGTTSTGALESAAQGQYR